MPPDPCSADEYRDHRHRRDRWLAEHGIDPADWSERYAVLVASWKAHGIVTARARLRVVDLDDGDVA